MKQIAISPQDKRHYSILRDNVRAFLQRVPLEYKCNQGFLLDIAPQIHEGARPFFPDTIHVDTMDIDPTSGSTYIGDICVYNECIKDNSYDYIVCTEVLEHTLQPFDAIEEIYRVARPGGLLLLTVPFNFRIHGPLPDCWRFTEHGLRAILRRWDILELSDVKTPRRPLMPIHYTVVAQKPFDEPR
jgi:SAM-dependent methyltransferase